MTIVHSSKNIKNIEVPIAEVLIGDQKTNLRTVLGSCVGIAFVWKAKGITGLAHCFLPEGTESVPIIGARYVDQAIYSLMTLMDIGKEDVGEIDVYLSGGGSLFISDNSINVGLKNLTIAKKILTAKGFHFEEMYTGKTSGCWMIVNGSDMSVSVRNL